MYAAVWAVSLLTHRNGHVSFLAPLAVLLALPAGVCAQRIWLTRPRWVLVSILLVPLVMSLRYSHVLSQPDTRTVAERKLQEMPDPGRVVIDVDGPQPDMNRVALESLEDLLGRRGVNLSGRQRHRLERLSEGDRAGLDVLPIEEVLNCEYSASAHAGLPARFRRRTAHRAHLAGQDARYTVWPGGDERPWPGGQYVVPERLSDLGSDPGELLRALGVRYLLLAEFNPGREEPHPLLPLTGGNEPTWVVEPGSERLDEARLPLEMEFPLVSLWLMDRPGPRLALYELPE